MNRFSPFLLALVFVTNLGFAQTPRIFTIQDDANGLVLPKGNWVKSGKLWINEEGDIAAGPDVSKDYIQQYIQSANKSRADKAKQDQIENNRRKQITDAYCQKSFTKNSLTADYFEDVGRKYFVNPNDVSFNRTFVTIDGLGEPVCALIFYTPKGPKTCWALFLPNSRIKFKCE